MKILITGGTGFIGKKVVRLLEKEVEKIYLLVRKQSIEKAREAFPDSPKIHIIEGDILRNDVVSRVEDVDLLSEEVDHVLHLAAKYDLTMEVLEAYTHNVIGVQNTLTLCRKLENLKYFHHISTYAVNGARGGRILEQELADNTAFPDHYSKSKKQGEHLVRTMELPGVKKRIYRPGIVIGDSHTGEIEKIDGPYYFFKFLHQMKRYHPLIDKLGMLPIPHGKKTVFPVIPVDVLSEWIAKSVLSPTEDEEIRSYHFIGDRQLTIKKFLDLSLPEMGIMSPVRRLKRHNLYRHVLPQVGMPKELMPYMFMEATYDVSLRKSDFDHKEFDIEEMIPRLVKGAGALFEKGIV